MISIQILRGLAALVVVLFHITKKGVVSGDYPFNFFEFGQFGVEIFFIISGFIMSYITAGKEFHLPSFMTRRAVRILPMYWLFTTVALGALIAMPKLAFTHTEFPPGLVTSYLLIPEPSHSLLLMVGWTLSYELLFYLVFALTARLPGRPVAVVLGMLWGLSFIPSESFYVQFIFNDFWAEFLVGTLLFEIVNRKAALFSVGATALLIFLIFDHFGLPDRRSVYFGLPAVAIVSIALGLEGTFEKWCPAFILRTQRFLGDASYSIYLSHFFSLNIAYVAIYKLLKLSGRPAGAIYFILAIVISLFVGGLVHVLIEKKILRALQSMGERNAKTYVIGKADTGAS